MCKLNQIFPTILSSNEINNIFFHSLKEFEYLTFADTQLAMLYICYHKIFIFKQTKETPVNNARNKSSAVETFKDFSFHQQENKERDMFVKNYLNDQEKIKNFIMEVIIHKFKC
jgi:hypothetical protein